MLSTIGGMESTLGEDAGAVTPASPRPSSLDEDPPDQTSPDETSPDEISAAANG